MERQGRVLEMVAVQKFSWNDKWILWWSGLILSLQGRKELLSTLPGSFGPMIKSTRDRLQEKITKFNYVRMCGNPTYIRSSKTKREDDVYVTF